MYLPGFLKVTNSLPLKAGLFLTSTPPHILLVTTHNKGGRAISNQRYLEIKAISGSDNAKRAVILSPVEVCAWAFARQIS
jgi:hypothetical protein